MKNNPFTNIEFLIDIVGPISLLPEHWYVLSHFFQVLDNIETRENINNLKEMVKLKKFPKMNISGLNISIGF